MHGVPTKTTGNFLTILGTLQGIPYVWGGNNPKIGFDCSGLIQYALMLLGYKNVPRTSQQQYSWVTHITRAQLRPGDLVFYHYATDSQGGANHVSVYNGQNTVIQAPAPGGHVSLGLLDSANVIGYGRIPNITVNTNPGKRSTDAGGVVPGETVVWNTANDLVKNGVKTVTNIVTGPIKLAEFFGNVAGYLGKIGISGIFTMIAGLIILFIGIRLLFGKQITTVIQTAKSGAETAALAA